MLCEVGPDVLGTGADGVVPRHLPPGVGGTVFDTDLPEPGDDPGPGGGHQQWPISV
jgi:hypothetical protein